MNDYEYFIRQLNLLVGFLDVSDEKIYQQIKQHDRFNMGVTIEELYEASYSNYLNHITTSSLLLGFAHLEDFLAKVVIKMLIESPEKNDYKLTLKTITERGDTLIISLAEDQSRRMTFSEKLKFIEKNLPGISQEIISQTRFVNDIRNCLMHNNGFADIRITLIYQDGQRIVLSSGQVNGYGLTARHLASQIWDRL